MAFNLSFSPDFFLAEGEPYDRSDLALNPEGKPVSVYSALLHLKQDDPEAWAKMVEDCFPPGTDPKHLNPEDVLDLIQETNTCGTLTSPIDVWIDTEGVHRVWVYE